MPPKKDKKQALAKPDKSGIPKQEVEIKFSFKIKSQAEQLPNYVVMFQWFGSTSEKIERFDSGLIQSWKKENDSIYSFQKIFDPIRVQDDFCKSISSRNFFVYFVNAQDSRVEDQLNLDYSSLLTSVAAQQQKPKFSFKSSTIKVLDIDSFSLEIQADKQLLLETYRHYLNPFQVQVIGAKDVPIDSMNKYEPAYVKYTFYDGTQVSTNPVVGNNTLFWSHKHVFLVGFMNPNELKQKIRSKYLKFELHDRDQINNTKIKQDVQIFDITKAIQEQMEKEKPVQQDPKKKGSKKEAKQEPKKDVKKDTKKKDVKIGEPILAMPKQTFKNNYGIGAFYLIDFLKPSMRNAKYKVPIVPRNTFEDFESRNIDLNTTARNQMQKIISTNNYFELDTKLVAGFTLSYGIGTFVEPQIPEEPIQQDPKKKKETKQQLQPVQNKKQTKKKEREDVFERVVYIIPYKSPELIQKIESVFYDSNLSAFSMRDRRQLTTYVLNADQKASINIDYLTGVQIIDPQSRTYILQGLRDGAIKKLHNIMEKSEINTKNRKILKNTGITYLKRLYTDFNIEVKRLRLRPSLSHILSNPNVYIKSKIAEQINQNLNRISDIRKLCNDLRSVDQMNLWPQSQWLIQIQRKFCDSLLYEDIYGCQETKQKRKIKNIGQSHGKKNKTIKFLESAEPNFLNTNPNFSLPKIQNSTNQGFYSEQNQNQLQAGLTSTKKHVITKTFQKDSAKSIQNFTMHMKKASIPENQPVYIYAGQKNNFYERQMRQLRQKISKDANAVYTLSGSYLSLSIDPRNLQQEQKRDKQFSKSKMYNQQHPFSSLLVKTKEQRMRLPKKPSDRDIEDMKNFPFYLDQQRQKEMTKNTRDQPTENSSKDQFKKYIKKQQVFSQPQVIQGQKISPVQRFKMQQQQKKKHDQQFKAKLKGDPVIRVKKNALSQKATGIDRFKDIREGSPNKLGLIDVHKKTQKKRAIQEYEVSLFLNQQKIDPSHNPLVRRDDVSKNMEFVEFNNYQRPQVLTYTKIYKPLKRQ